MLMLRVGLVATALTQPPLPSQAPTQTVTGRVVESGSLAPIIGARVILARLTSTPAPIVATEQTVLTDQRGRYVFVDVEPGRYGVHAEKGGYTGPGSFAQPFGIGVGQQHVVPDLVLMLGAVITGRVLDPVGQPLANARVAVYQAIQASAPGGGDRMPARLSSPGGQTDDLGQFRLFGFAPGTYYVQAAPQLSSAGGIEAAPGKVLSATFYGDTTELVTAQPIAVAPGQTFGEVVIHIAMLPAFEVSGVVVDEAGQPIANADVMLVLEDIQSARWGADVPSRGHCGADGHFTIRAVANGTYKLIGSAPLSPSQPPSSAAGTPAGIASGTDYRLVVTVSDANITGLRVTVPRPQRRPN
jgi:hypothetical protein